MRTNQSFKAFLRRCALVAVPVFSYVQFTAVSEAQSIAITDMENRSVTLAKPAERIASIPIPMASTIIAFDGATSRLVGMNPRAKSAIVDGIMGKMFPEAKNISSEIVGQNFMPNVESLASVRPDLVVQWGGRGDDIVKPLTNAGMTTMLILYGTEERTRTYLGLIATTLGKPARALENIAWRDQVLADLASKLSAVPADKRPRVLHISNALTNLAVTGKGDFFGKSLELAGGKNVVDGVDWSTPTNLEQIAMWDPEVITLNGFEDELTPEFVYKNPILSLTKAAQNKRIYKLPIGGYRWDPPSQESPLMWMWAANLLHPQIFNYDLRAETQKAFQILYSYQATQDDLDGVLRMSMHGSAAHYNIFARR